MTVTVTRTNGVNAAIGPDSTVRGQVRQPDGKLVVVGSFSNVNGVAQAQIARFNTNGTLDTSFTNALSGGTSINGVLYDSGNLVIVGSFTSVNGDGTQQSIAKLDTNGVLEITIKNRVAA